MVRGDLRNSIAVIIDGEDVFIGIRRSARSSEGERLVNLGELHELGGPPTIIPITPKMRRFLFALLRQAGQVPTGGSGRGVVVVQVPPRPFLRPAFAAYRVGAGRRFLDRVAHQLGLGAPD